MTAAYLLHSRVDNSLPLAALANLPVSLPVWARDAGSDYFRQISANARSFSVCPGRHRSNLLCVRAHTLTCTRGTTLPTFGLHLYTANIYSQTTAKRLYLRLNYSRWQCTVTGCNSIQPNHSSDTFFDCNYEFWYIHGKFSNFWLQFGCTKKELVWYAAFNYDILLILERFCY